MSAGRRYYPSAVTVLAIDDDGGQMDCCDDDPRHIWVVTGWSHRRAVKTHAEPFLKAAGTEDVYSLEGRMFLARLDLGNPPPFEHEGGERLEWPELTLAPSMDEVRNDLGLPPRQPVVRGAEFDVDTASAGLRAFLGTLRQFTAEESTQIVVNAGHAWYKVSGAEYDNTEVELKLDLSIPFHRPPPGPEDFEYPDDGSYPGGLPLHTMDFSEAAGFAEDWRATITREEWEEAGIKRFLRWDENLGVMVVVVDDKEPEVWVPAQDEVLSIDWCIVQKDDTPA